MSRASCREKKAYLITYEDGDREEMDTAEVMAHLVTSPQQLLEIQAQIDSSSSDSMSTSGNDVQDESGETKRLRLTTNVAFFMPPKPLPPPPLPSSPELLPRLSEFWTTHGLHCNDSTLDDETLRVIQALNETIPRPLLRLREESVPRSLVVGADCIRRLPPDLEFWFLSVVQKEQLVTIYRNCGTAKKFIRLSELKARGTLLEVSALASAKKLALMSLCRGLGLSTSSRNKKEEGMVLYQRTREHALELVETEIQCVLCAKRKLRS